DAVQIGTRFVTTEECDAPDAYKQAYLNAADEDVRIIQSPVGMPGRAIYNSFLKKIAEGKQNAVTRCHQCLEKCDPSSIPYCITDALVHAARGEMEDALIFCGGRVEECRKIQSVSEVIQEILG
ncbi:MAG: nitronate monooxygenase, partial [Clostridiales bacterium]|nr:nitronate monooxygenase [Clostridiales bacterium]